MKKSIFLFFAAILCAMSVSAKVIYFKPNGNWAAANANFYAHVWGGSGATSPVKFTPVATDPGVYEAEVGTHNQVIFLRMDPAKTVTSSNMWTSSDDGGPLWNRMGNLSIPTDGKNCCAIKDGQWSQDKNTTNGASSYVTWSTYTPPTETVKYTWTVAGTPASVFEVEWNPEHAANDMVEQADGTYKWEKTNIEFADESSTVKFKVCREHAWAVAHPSGDYELNISGAGIYTVTITFNTNGNTVNAVATKTGEYVGEAPTHTYSVTGSNADLFGTAWDPAVEENLMETADNVTYTWKKEGVTLMGNFEMKVVQDKAFSVAYPAQNKVVEITEPAIYTVSITFNATSQDIDVNLTKTGEAVIPPVKLYFVNTGNWTDLKAHVWADGGNPYKAWEESESMTDTGDDVYGFDVYSYEFPSNYNRIIFKGANDQKTSDDVAAYDAAKPYYCNGVWYASLSEIPAPESLTYTVTVPEGTEECWIAGQMNNWTLTKMNPGAAANQFTLDIVGAAIDHEYKYACKNDWAYAEVREADEHGNSNRKAWAVSDEVTAWGKPVVYTYYLMGVNDDWETGIEMEVNTDAENEVMLTCQPVNGQVKIKRVGDDASEHWFGGKSLKEDPANLGTNTEAATDGDGNIALEEGIYNFYFNTADGKLWIATATGCPPVTVTIDDPIGSMSTYTGVEENDGVWSKEYNIGEEVTIGIDELGDGWLFAYWTVGEEKIFTETYTFTVTEDITITANYGSAMDVAFDNMVLNQDSWVVTAGPEAGFGIELTLGIDVENQLPNGNYPLVNGSSISLGGNELELVTGYFTAIDPDAPSAEAVVFAVYEEILMAFVCTMTAAPAPAHNIVVTDATLSEQPGGFLFMNSTWSDGTETYPVQAEIPGFDANVASATYTVTVTIGGQGDEDPWLGFGEGEATVTVDAGLVTLTGHIENAWSGFKADVTISGTLPAPTTATVTVDDPIGSMSTYTGVDYDESTDTWSKVYNIGDEVTIGISEVGDGWAFAYWTVGSEKIFTETYTFTVTEDITITANYGSAMDVAFDNMELDQESWVVTAGPEAGFGIELTLGIDVENQLPNGNYPLVDGSSISLGGDELELVTGYFTAVDVDAPSAEAVVFAVYEEMLMAFVCTMTAAPAPAHNIVIENATLTNETGTSGFLYMNSTWSDGTETYPVQAEIPGFTVNAASATYAVTLTVGGQGDDDPWLGSAEGEVTVTVNAGLVTLTGSLVNGWTGFKADVTISGTLTKDYTRAIEEGNFGTICLPYGAQFIGAKLYELVGKDDKGVYLGEVTILEAGVPYIFLATATELVAYKDGTTATEAGKHNGLVGTFVDNTVVEVGNYILSGDKLCQAEAICYVNANRAYVVWDEVPAGAPVQMPGRRYISMGVHGENGTTGLDNIVAPEGQLIKTIENGQLIIIRGGEKFNAQGVRL